MIIDKSITLDLNRIQPLKVIRIHQGDVNSVNIVINVTNGNKSVDLTGKVVKYDATISNILAEQDATGSISGSKITIPITKNMTAHSGLLKVDIIILSFVLVSISNLLPPSITSNPLPAIQPTVELPD